MRFEPAFFIPNLAIGRVMLETSKILKRLQIFSQVSVGSDTFKKCKVFRQEFLGLVANRFDFIKEYCFCGIVSVSDDVPNSY